MTWSLRHAPTAALAPMQYLETPIAALPRFLVVQDLANPLTGLGIVITRCAGLYVTMREQATVRHQRATVLTPPAA